MHAIIDALDCMRIDFKKDVWILLSILLYITFPLYMPIQANNLKRK